MLRGNLPVNVRSLTLNWCLVNVGESSQLALKSEIMPMRYSLPFIKMQANGNDFIFLDGETLLDSAARPLLSQWPALAPNLAKSLCSRRFSIGADGLILALPLNLPELNELAQTWHGSAMKDCQISWTYHNSDGSVSNMCGNGLRCLGLWASHEKGLQSPLKVATALGAIDLAFNGDKITVALGAPRLEAKDIPFIDNLTPNEKVINKIFKLDKNDFAITCVNVGNPHCVIFEANFLKAQFFSTISNNNGDNFFPDELKSIAAKIEIDSRFPEKTNVEFVNVIDRKHIEVLVWERGCGPTLSCGSGAISAAIASILVNRTDKQLDVTLPGGTVHIDWSEQNIIKMTGEAHLAFRGQIEISSKQLAINAPKFAKAGAL